MKEHLQYAWLGFARAASPSDIHFVYAASVFHESASDMDCRPCLKSSPFPFYTDGHNEVTALMKRVR